MKYMIDNVYNDDKSFDVHKKSEFKREGTNLLKRIVESTKKKKEGREIIDLDSK